MTAADWIAILSGSLLASVLVHAGLAKLASPTALLGALEELLPDAFAVPAGAVPALACVEVAAGLGLLALPTRPVAGAGVAALGAVFAAAGLAGWRRGSHAPCGCTGGRGDRPLGPVNVLLGLALIAAAALGTRQGTSPAHAADFTAWAAVLTSAASLLLAMWTHRRLARSLLLPGREAAA